MSGEANGLQASRALGIDMKLDGDRTKSSPVPQGLAA